MPVLGKCSKCGFLHHQPFGKRCRYTEKLQADILQIEVDAMACITGSGFVRRDDPEYTAWLEDQYHQQATKVQQLDAQLDADKDTKVLAEVLQRLDNLERHRNAESGDEGAHKTAAGPGKVTPTAAEFSSLTDSINHLSLAVGGDSRDSPSKQGTELRPEFHVQCKTRGVQASNMNSANMKSEELLYGMLCVFLYLEEKSLDTRGYLQHFKFVARHIMERQFTTLACIKYDKYVVDEVIAGKCKFESVNQVAAGLFLHGGAVMIRDRRGERSTNASGIGSRSGLQSGRGGDPRQQTVNTLRDCNRENVPSYMPENWPQEICFNYNVRSCMGKCVKLHVCSHCNLRHRLSDCKFAIRDSQFHPQQQSAHW